jgi:hypothetical protein
VHLAHVEDAIRLLQVEGMRVSVRNVRAFARLVLRHHQTAPAVASARRSRCAAHPYTVVPCRRLLAYVVPPGPGAVHQQIGPETRAL